MMLPTAQQVVLGWDGLCSYLKGQPWAHWVYAWLRGDVTCLLPSWDLEPRCSCEWAGVVPSSQFLLGEQSWEGHLFTWLPLRQPVGGGLAHFSCDPLLPFPVLLGGIPYPVGPLTDPPTF